MRTARVVYWKGGVRLYDPDGHDQRREFREEDRQRLEQLSARYERAADRPQDLLEIGRELATWLDGVPGWWQRVVGSGVAPLGLEIELPPKEDSNSRALLMAPWELLADDDGFLALDARVGLVPWRRLGTATPGTEPVSTSALSVLFMAAAPEGQGHLDYEREERAILDATRELALDLFVEESGTAVELGRRLARLATPQTPVQVVHISCHGRVQPKPQLLLETMEGAEAPTDARGLVREVGGRLRKVGLVFVSACMTAQTQSQDVTSLAHALVAQGVQATLGWAGSVYDHEATAYAAALYERLAAGGSLLQAVAEAREWLVERELQKGRQARHWHLARLLLGPRAGAPLAVAGAPRRVRRNVVQEFLDPERLVEVAGPERFVGRRREIQQALRALRGDQFAGVLVHGVGHQGKSSLAARVVQRMPSHTPVVVFRRYGGLDVFDRIETSLPNRAAAREWRDSWRATVGEDGSGLEDALRSLLEGPCRGGAENRPLLLVIDDLERILQAVPGQRHRVGPGFVGVMEAVVAAFARAQTQSSVLLTSRFEFSLSDDRGDILVPGQLFELSLPGMKTYEATKQALAVGRAGGFAGGGAGVRAEQVSDAVEAALGSPGLLDVLLAIAREDAQRFREVLEQMRSFRESGVLPSDVDVEQRLRSIAVAGLLALLSPTEKELARASLLFEAPFPEEVAQVLANAVGASAVSVERLRGHGVWEVHREPEEAGDTLLLSRLVGASLGAEEHGGGLSREERRSVAKVVLPKLLQLRSGVLAEDAPSWRTQQLVELAVWAEDASVAARYGAAGILHCDTTMSRRRAAVFAKGVVECVQSGGLEAPMLLLYQASEATRSLGAGEAERASAWLERVAQRLDEKGRPARMEDALEAGILSAYGQQLVAQGDPDGGLVRLKRAEALFRAAQHEREAVITLGYIARIRVSKGEVDEALKLHEEMLKVFEELGDTRSRAVTLGDIARIWVDKGEVDEALKLHEERLKVFEELGDKGGRAHALWSIGKIALGRGDGQAAYDALDESYRTNVELGRLEGIIQVGIDFGQLLALGGHPKDAIEVLERSLDGLRRLGRAGLAEQVRGLLDQVRVQASAVSPP